VPTPSLLLNCIDIFAQICAAEGASTGCSHGKVLCARGLPKSPGALDAMRRLLVLAALLAALVLVVYWPTLGNDFVNYDDDRYVTENPHVQQGFDAASLRWAWTSGHFYWHPLTSMSHMLDWRLYGAAPAGHHATSVVLHAANTALVFLVLAATTGAEWRSALVAALFGLHPLRVESVAWVAERKDVLSGFFWLLTTLVYAWYARAPSRGRMALVALGLALGLMAKPMLVTLPCTLLLLDWWPLGRLRTRDDLWPLVREKLLLLPIVAASIAVTLALEDAGVMSLAEIPPAVRIQNALVSYAAYLGMMLWPVDLYVPYLHPRGGIPAWSVAGAAILLGAVTAVAWRLRATRPYLLVGWLWYLGTLVPVIGLTQAGEQAMADRFTYVPQIGITTALVWLLPAGAGLPLAVGAAVVLALLATRTRAQIAVWRSSETLFAHALAVDERNPVAHLNLGYALGRRGALDGARRHLERALELRPQSPRAHVGLGNVLASSGHPDEAVAHYGEALAMDPESEHALANLGFTLAGQGRTDEAIALYRRALAVDPSFAVAHRYLGVALANAGRPAEALPEFEQAVRLNARDADAWSGLGVALMATGRVPEGLAAVDRALALDPRLAGAHVNRILGLSHLGRWADAWAAVRAARAAGVEPPAPLVQALAERMPEPLQ
jgi:tetratricopeptide (TPR) repeat protein